MFFITRSQSRSCSNTGWLRMPCIMQCCGSASIIMQIRIQDPKNVHANPDLRELTLTHTALFGVLLHAAS